MGFDPCRSVGGDDECDDDDKFRAEVSIVKSLLSVASDGSPLVRAEVAVGRWWSIWMFIYIFSMCLWEEFIFFWEWLDR